MDWDNQERYNRFLDELNFELRNVLGRISQNSFTQLINYFERQKEAIIGRQKNVLSLEVAIYTLNTMRPFMTAGGLERVRDWQGYLGVDRKRAKLLAEFKQVREAQLQRNHVEPSKRQPQPEPIQKPPTPPAWHEQVQEPHTDQSRLRRLMDSYGDQCPVCATKMSLSQLEKHIADAHRYTEANCRFCQIHILSANLARHLINKHRGELTNLSKSDDLKKRYSFPFEPAVMKNPQAFFAKICRGLPVEINEKFLAWGISDAVALLGYLQERREDIVMRGHPITGDEAAMIIQRVTYSKVMKVHGRAAAELHQQLHNFFDSASGISQRVKRRSASGLKGYCPVCHQLYALEWLDWHVHVIHQEKEIHCQYCDYAMHPNGLVEHLTKRHLNELLPVYAEVHEEYMADRLSEDVIPIDTPAEAESDSFPATQGDPIASANLLEWDTLERFTSFLGIVPSSTADLLRTLKLGGFRDLFNYLEEKQENIYIELDDQQLPLENAILILQRINWYLPEIDDARYDQHELPRIRNLRSALIDYFTESLKMKKQGQSTPIQHKVIDASIQRPSSLPQAPLTAPLPPEPAPIELSELTVSSPLSTEGLASLDEEIVLELSFKSANSGVSLSFEKENEIDALQLEDPPTKDLPEIEPPAVPVEKEQPIPLAGLLTSEENYSVSEIEPTQPISHPRAGHRTTGKHILASGLRLVHPLQRTASSDVTRTTIEDRHYIISQATLIKTERANLLHKKTLEILHSHLTKLGVKMNQTFLIDGYAEIGGPQIFEVKSINDQNEKSQVRHAIAQLYEYRYLYQVPEAGLWLVLSSQLETEWLLDYLIHDRDIRILWVDNGLLSGPSEAELLECIQQGKS